MCSSYLGFESFVSKKKSCRYIYIVFDSNSFEVKKMYRERMISYFGFFELNECQTKSKRGAKAMGLHAWNTQTLN